MSDFTLNSVLDTFGITQQDVADFAIKGAKAAASGAAGAAVTATINGLIFIGVVGGSIACPPAAVVAGGSFIATTLVGWGVSKGIDLAIETGKVGVKTLIAAAA